MQILCLMLQFFSVCAVQANVHFHTLPKISGLVVFSPHQETQLWADITPLSTQPSCENAANEVVRAKCGHRPALLLWKCSHITLIGILGVLKLFHPAPTENLLRSHHRWLMASSGCGFHSFNPQGTSWFSLLQAVRDKGLLSAPWTKDFTRLCLGEAITAEWDPHPQRAYFSIAEAFCGYLSHKVKVWFFFSTFIK